MTQNYKMFDNRKYMWDGKSYDSEDAANLAAQKYEKENFEVLKITENSKYLIYTRRVATSTTPN